MVWVEARAFGVPLATVTIAAAFVYVMLRLHAPFAGTFVFTMIIIAAVSVAGRVWSNALNRGRKARYVPIVINALGIGSGVLAAGFKLWNAAAMQHSRQDAISLLTGAVTALMLVALALRSIARSTGRRREARVRSGKGRTRDALSA